MNCDPSDWDAKMQIEARSSVIGGIPRPETRGTERREPAVRSSVKIPSGANDNLIDRTVAVWERRLERDLSREEARQMVENITGFFNILAEWSQAEMPRSANDNVRPEVRGAESETRSDEAMRPGEQGESQS
jgi:hypothetical protein